MATNDIGRVTPIWRGFYSAATTYELNDIVIDTAGSVWWHKSEEQTTGVAPAVGDFWDAVIDMSIFSGLIQTAIVTAQTAVQAAQAAETGVAEDVQRAETAAGNAETYAQNAQTSAANVGAYAQAAEAAKNAAAGSAESAGSSATAAAGSKSDAEAYAVGKRGGTDVGVDDPTYHNNAKYYADQAGSSAEAAAGSKSDAEAYAVGKRGGEDVGSEDPAYHNNAKYWSEQAEATAEDIADSSAQIAQNAADVADVKTQLTNGQNDGLFRCELVWEHGGVNPSTGENVDNGSTTRSRTDFLITSDYVKLINNLDVNKSLYVIYYDENKTFKTASACYSPTAPSVNFNSAYKYFRLYFRAGFEEIKNIEIYQASSYIISDLKVADSADFTYLYSQMFEQGGIVNGTGLEYSGREFVRTRYIPVISQKSLKVTNPNTNEFWYSIHQYDASKTWLGALTLVDTNAIKTFSLNANCCYIRIVVLRNGYGALTQSDVDSSRIRFEWEYITATTYREAFAYLGDGGNFLFKENPPFNASTALCAWRVTTSIIIKLPKVTNGKTFTMEQIINSLTNSDLYTDSDNITWVRMRPGYGLVYNDETGTLQSVDISGSTPLADKMYPLLLVWWLQVTGGMLYVKFMHDLQNLVIENKSNTSIKTELDNSRHIAGDTISPLTLLHISDIHADTTAYNRIYEDALKYGDKIEGKICTGDMVANTAAQIGSWWKSDIMTCIGNHDSASYDASTGYDWTALSMADRDAYYIAPFESNWGITHTSGTSYYYKDYSTQKVRLIVMDAMLYTDNGADATTQTAWLSNLLSDAITNNLHVLIAIHAPHGGATAVDCSFSKYNEGVRPTTADCNTPQTIIDTVSASIGNGLKFIGYLVGHTHQDDIWDAEDNGKQLMYCITCATTGWSSSDQYRGIGADAYNIVTIDTAHTLVKIVRGGGANIDDHMRTRKAICFNYTTGEKVGEVL